MKAKNKKQCSAAVPPPHLFLKPQLCPEAILAWSNTVGKTRRTDMADKAKSHLSALGWKFWYKKKSTSKMELRYQSPAGKVFYSLRTACKACVAVEEEKRKRENDDDVGAQEQQQPRPKKGKKVLAVLKRLRDEKRVTRKSRDDDENYDECSVCCYGGELVLCDACPNAFHKGCIGLDDDDVGDGDWFCKACCCGLCSFGLLENEDGGGEALTCDQCGHRYHSECLGYSGEGKCSEDGKLFCSGKCENVFVGMEKILGEAVVVGPDNLTWTLLKTCTTFDAENSTKNYLKHKLALNVMHGCFEPTQDPHTKSDMAEDVIFNRQKKFSQFYTAVLERDEDVICAATVRVYGEVGEVPLVATMFKYRRHGMCQILMCELERQLAKLGVERMVLPSARDALEAWTSASLGYSKMNDDERLRLLDYSFLNFQDTVMCHKLLKQQNTTIIEEGKNQSDAISIIKQAVGIEPCQELINIDYDYDLILEDDNKFMSWLSSGSREVLAI